MLSTVLPPVRQAVFVVRARTSLDDTPAGGSVPSLPRRVHMFTLTKPEVTATAWKRAAAWGGPPLFVAVAVAAIWLFDVQGATGARDTVYVVAALLWAPVLLVATRLWYVDRFDVSLHRACEIAQGLALALFFLSFFLGMLHEVGGWAIGVSAVAWFVLAMVGIFRTGHLVYDRYGPGGWAP